MFSQLGQMADLMRNAGKIRESMEKATESLGSVQVKGSAGGGVVTIELNGHMQVIGTHIDPQLLKDGDAELLEDLVTAAVNQAIEKAREAAAQTLSTSIPGLPMSGLSGLSGLFGGS